MISLKTEKIEQTMVLKEIYTKHFCSYKYVKMT